MERGERYIRKLTEMFLEIDLGGGTWKSKLGVRAVGTEAPVCSPSIKSWLTRLLSSAVRLADPFSAKNVARLELSSAGEAPCS